MKYPNLSLAKFRTLALKLGAKYRNTPQIIGLIGALGAGKTTFTKVFAKALGVKAAKSPSFVVVHKYDGVAFNFYHIDFYRLSQLKQLEPLGLDEICNGENMVLIEWVDKFPRLQKLCDTVITIKINPNQTRDVTIQKN